MPPAKPTPLPPEDRLPPEDPIPPEAPLTPQGDDAELISAAQQKNGRAVAAFTSLVGRYQSPIRAFLAVRLADPTEAEDLAQEVFLTAYRKLSDCDPERPFLPWLRGIAQNLWRNHQRKFRAIPLGGNEDLQLLLDNRLASEWSKENECKKLTALRDCLDGVDAPSRALIQARYGDGLSVQELSAQYGHKHSTLTMQLHRMRASLAACIQGKLASQAAGHSQEGWT